MIAQRIIAVSPLSGFGTELESALVAAGGEVEVHPSLDAVPFAEQVALCVIHFAHDPALAVLARLSRECRVIAILPRANLAALVEIMRASDRVTAMMVAEDFDPATLAAIARRLLDGALFGLDKVLPPGTAIQSLVCDYPDRSRTSAIIYDFVVKCRIARKYHPAIEQCVDEMLMNALYDAPVDADGTRIFGGMTPRTRVTLRIATQVVVQYAYDGVQLAISVRDAFGSIERETVLRVLHKCLHAAQKVDRKAGGAGVGLYLMVNAATAVYFNVVPGVATEAICLFRVDSPTQLQHFGFFKEATDVTGTLAHAALTEGALRPVEMRRPVRVAPLIALGVAAVAAFGLLAVGFWPRLFGHEEAAPPRPATVELDSDPTGAAVVIDGNRRGETPLTLTTLAPGSSVAIVFTRTGYRPAMASLQVPAAGERTTFVQPLTPSDDLVRVRFVTEPPGAQVIRLEEARATAARTYTPAELFVAAGEEQRFMLAMPHHVPVVIDPFTPARGGGLIVKSAKLVPGVTLHVQATRGGTIDVVGARHCIALTVPAECPLAPGTYEVAYKAPDGATLSRTVELVDADVTTAFEVSAP